ncbi:MAG: DNA alkylation repair protein [Gloeobacteraceae cyanobacterium ES-bin-316]|nr:DNA alkylation repair protein [Ferruginibacter sp.]
MAELLKNIYNPVFFDEFTIAISKAKPRFDKGSFCASIQSEGWDKMELKQRMRHIASVLHKELAGNYPQKLEQLLKIMDFVPRKSAGEYGSLAYMLIPDFVEQYGLDDLKISLEAMERITQFTSCEFAVRPYLLKYPDTVMPQMFDWSLHPSEKVRRFSSEGCRPRLPWAMAIPFLKKDPSPILPILENLQNDSSEFVRRSVANNLNDISKDHPGLVIEITKKWIGHSPATDRILKHGCRSLLKKSNIETLQLFGTAAHTKCSVLNLGLDALSIRIGEQIKFSFDVVLKEKKVSFLRLEYLIYFMKANGKASKKIFKIAESEFEPLKIVSYKRKHSFKDLTTRKHYTGLHMLSIVVNGQELQSIHFHLTASSKKPV